MKVTRKTIVLDKQLDGQTVLIKCEAQDVADYMNQVRQLNTPFQSIKNLYHYMKGDTTINTTTLSFNDFIKYRYVSSTQNDANQYRADLSFLDLSRLDLSEGNFNYTYAINTNFNNTNLELTKLNHCVLIKAQFDGASIHFTEFSYSNLSYSMMKNTYGACICDHTIATKLDADQNFQIYTPHRLPQITLPAFKLFHSKQAIGEKIEQHVNSFVTISKNTAITASLGFEGSLIGAAEGFVMANLFMAFATPTVGAAVAYNLSTTAAVLSGIEGCKYYLGSENSYLIRLAKFMPSQSTLQSYLEQGKKLLISKIKSYQQATDHTYDHEIVMIDEDPLNEDTEVMIHQYCDPDTMLELQAYLDLPNVSKNPEILIDQSIEQYFAAPGVTIVDDWLLIGNTDSTIIETL